MDNFKVRKYAEPELMITVEGTDHGLVTEWHFDEGSGTTVKDNTGNGNDGIMHDQSKSEPLQILHRTFQQS